MTVCGGKVCFISFSIWVLFEEYGCGFFLSFKTGKRPVFYRNTKALYLQLILVCIRDQ